MWKQTSGLYLLLFPALHCKYLINTTSRHAKEAPAGVDKLTPHASRPIFDSGETGRKRVQVHVRGPKRASPLASSRTCANHANGQPLASIHSCTPPLRQSLPAPVRFPAAPFSRTPGEIYLWSCGPVVPGQSISRINSLDLAFILAAPDRCVHATSNSSVLALIEAASASGSVAFGRITVLSHPETTRRKIPESMC